MDLGDSYGRFSGKIEIPEEVRNSMEDYVTQVTRTLGDTYSLSHQPHSIHMD